MRFRKKPVIIDAIQFTGENINEVESFMNPNHVVDTDCSDISIKISTLEGEMTANIGDWIIRGVKGEFYPCKCDIFELTYEQVSWQ